MIIKVNVNLQQPNEGPEREQKYSSTLSLTSALDGDGWSMPRTVAVPPGKTAGIHCIEGWVDPQSQSGRVLKTSPPNQDSIPKPSSQ